MAEFTGNIHNVTFIDYPQNTLLEILYKNPDDDHIGFTPWHMEVDFTNNDFKDKGDILKLYMNKDWKKVTFKKVTTKGNF